MPRLAVANAFGDYCLICPTILFGEQLATHAAASKRFYAYRLMQAMSPIMPNAPKWLGAVHGSDSFYLFMGPMLRTPEEQQLSHDLIAAITNFARSGQPTAMGGVEWTEAIDRKHGGDSEKATRYMSLHVKDYRMVAGHYVPTCNQFWSTRIVLQ